MSKLVILLLAVGLTVLSAHADPENPCETALVSHLSTFKLDFSLRPGPLSGLPASNVGREIFKRPSGNVRLSSDVGVTYWDNVELEEWFTLNDHGVLQYPDVAKRELERVVNEIDYCTPGLAKDLCRQVRSSFATFQRLKPQGLFDFRASEEHQRFGRTEFPFGIDPDHRELMSPERALSLMRLMARENLLRHLPKGLELESGTRILLAWHPELIPLYPALMEFPLDLPGGKVLGERGFESEEVEVRIAGYLVSYDFAIKDGPEAWLFLTEKPLSDEGIDHLEEEALRELQRFADFLSQRLQLSQPLEIEIYGDGDQIAILTNSDSRAVDFIYFWYLESQFRKR